MKRLLVMFSCALALSVAAPSAVSASNNIRLWHRHHNAKDPSKPAEAAKPPKAKEKHSLLHRSKASREQAAHSEATYGMTGPKSVGLRHPQPGPAGYGAN